MFLKESSFLSIYDNPVIISRRKTDDFRIDPLSCKPAFQSAAVFRQQKEVTDMTNALLKKNAETLKVATIETARESQRGIVDIETLTATNKTLISTLDEVMKIQEDGRAKRKSAEQELVRIEDEMRQKLLSVSRSSGRM